MIAQALLTTFVTFFAMGLGYLFHFFMTRTLGPSLYGELSVIIGFISILSVPVGPIQTLLAREIAKLDKKKREKTIIWVVKKYSKIVFISGLVFAAVVFFSSSFVSSFFNDSLLSFPLKLIACALPFMFLLPILRAYYQGREKFTVFCAIGMIEPSVKLGLGIVLVLMGFGLNGAVLGIVFSWIVLFLFFIPLIFKKTESKRIKLKLGKSYFFILLTSIILTVFFYADLFFIRYYLDAEQAGYYNVAAITSRVLVYGVGGVITVLYPKTSKLSAKNDKKKVRELVIKSLLIILPVFVLFLAFPKEIITFFYSSKYLASLNSFVILSLGMFVFSIFNLFLTLFWSQNYEKIPLISSAVVLLLDILLLNYLVPLKGIEGAALATSLSSLFFLISSLLGLKKFLL